MLQPRPRIMVVAGRELSSRAIEGFGGGRWSHMANILSDGTVLDAFSQRMHLEGKWYEAGVQLRPAGYLEKKYRRWAMFQAPYDSYLDYEEWSRAGMHQLGKPYDSDGIIAFAVGLFTGRYRDRNYVHAHPERSSAWFCDELCAHMGIVASQLPQPPHELRLSTLTPGGALNLFIGAGWQLVASRG